VTRALKFGKPSNLLDENGSTPRNGTMHGEKRETFFAGCFPSFRLRTPDEMEKAKRRLNKGAVESLMREE
jgi:hypothetical protein